MRAVDIMTTPVRTTTSTASVRSAAETMLRHRVASLPVVDDGHLVGILSEIDIARVRAPHDPRSRMRTPTVSTDDADPATRVGSLMTREVVCVSPGDDTSDLASVLSHSGVRAVPVVDDGRVVGIVSRRDLLRAVERDDGTLCREIVARLESLVGHGGCPWRVDVRDGVATVTGPVADDREADVLRVLAGTVAGVVRTHVVAAETRPATRTSPGSDQDGGPLPDATIAR